MAREFAEAVEQARLSAEQSPSPEDDRRDAPARYAPLRASMVVLGLVVLGASVFGLVDDTDGFGGNLVAEIAGVGLGVVLSVVLIDSLLRRQREQDWRHVRDHLTADISRNVVALATEFHLTTKEPYEGSLLAAVGANTLRPRTEIALALRALRNHLEALTPALAGQADADAASSRTLHTAVKVHLDSIRDFVTPRVIAVGLDIVLVEKLLAFEQAEAEWRSWIHQVEFELAPSTVAWTLALSTLDSATTVYSYLVTAHKAE